MESARNHSRVIDMEELSDISSTIPYSDADSLDYSSSTDSSVTLARISPLHKRSKDYTFKHLPSSSSYSSSTNSSRFSSSSETKQPSSSSSSYSSSTNSSRFSSSSETKQPSSSSSSSYSSSSNSPEATLIVRQNRKRCSSSIISSSSESTQPLRKRLRLRESTESTSTPVAFRSRLLANEMIRRRLDYSFCSGGDKESKIAYIMKWISSVEHKSDVQNPESLNK